MSERRTWIVRLALVAIIVSLGLTAAGTAAQAQAPDTPAIVGLRLNGVVDPFLADYIRRGVESANDDGAPAVLIWIDTPGGLSSSMREMTQAILGSRIPVICYVAPEGARAASAGAFVLMSCPVAAMAPGTNVGAATPVGVSGVVLQRKVTEDAIASIRSMAEIYDRNADVAESFVRDATSISAEQALDENVIDLIEPSDDALLADVSGTTVTLGDRLDRHCARSRGRAHRRTVAVAGSLVPARAHRPEPRLHLLLARPGTDHLGADRAGTHLLRDDRHDPAAHVCRLVRAPAGSAPWGRPADRVARLLRGGDHRARARHLVDRGTRLFARGWVAALRRLWGRARVAHGAGPGGGRRGALLRRCRLQGCSRFGISHPCRTAPMPWSAGTGS